MTRPPSSLRIVLFSMALGLAGCFGGGFAPSSPSDYIEELRSAVQREIEDPALQAELLKSTERLSAALEEFGAELEAAHERLEDLSRSHGSTREEMRGTIEEMADIRQSFLDEVIDVRLSMREKMSRSQWNAVAGRGFLAGLGIG